MEVASILDAYTTAYGWSVYKLIFLFLVALGAPLYPIAMILSDLASGYAERGGDPKQIVPAAMYRFVMYFLVVIFAFLPSIPLDMEVAKIRTPCGTIEMQQNINVTEQQFEFEQTHVPAVPWIAMQAASGLKAVINTMLPCVEDLTATNQALRSLDISQAEDPAQLNTEQNRFAQECFVPSVEHYQRTVRGQYGQPAADRMRELSQEYVDDNDTAKEMILSLPSSTFLRAYFYQKPELCEGLIETDAMYYYCLGLPIKAQGPVDQIDGNETSLLSQYQQSIGETIPTCAEWFNTPDVGLRDRLFDAAEKKITSQASYILSGYASRVNPGLSSGVSPSDATTVTRDLYSSMLNASQENYRDFMVDRLYTNAAQKSGSLLSEQNQSTLNVIAGAGAIGTIAGVFNIDLAESIGQEAVSFYSSAMIFKVAASLFQPLLLSGIFMFWGIYLIISRMQGEAMFMGAIMIFLISIIPGIWAIGNHLDDKLYVAMFPQTESLADILKSPSDHLQRLILDVVSTVYYIILPMILLYVAAMAGTSAQTIKATSDSIQSPSSQGGGNIGRKSSSISGKGITKLREKIKAKTKN